jgi:hypothetical protein
MFPVKPIQLRSLYQRDPTRIRWGFELTVLDTSDEKAGELQSLDATTQDN